MNRNNLIIIIIGVVIIGALGILFVKSKQSTLMPVDKVGKETQKSLENNTKELEEKTNKQIEATPTGAKKLPDDVEKDLKSLDDEINTLGTDSPNDYSDL